MTLSKWMRRAAIDDGERPGTSTSESAENRELKKRVRLLEQENEVLRRAAAYLGQAASQKADVPARARARRRRDPCRGVVSGTRSCSPALLPMAEAPIVGPARRGHLANAIHNAHGDDPEFGYRFLADEVRVGDHPDVSDRIVWRICRDNEWWSVFGKPKRRKGSRPGTPSHDDLVRRDFTAEGPNELWLADIERHEALPNRVVMKGHHRVLVAASAMKLRAA